MRAAALCPLMTINARLNMGYDKPFLLPTSCPVSVTPTSLYRLTGYGVMCILPPLAFIAPSWTYDTC